MRLSVAIAIACLTLIGLSFADESQASIKKLTNIRAESLSVALQTLAKERNFQIIYVSEEINALHTQGAVGEFTPEEALKQLLNGTGLTYRYLDDRTVTIVPVTSPDLSNITAEPEAASSNLEVSRMRVAQAAASESPNPTRRLTQIHQFDIPAQDAITGIPQFAKQASIEIRASESIVLGKRTNAVRGPYDLQKALRLLLARSGLKVASNDGNAITLSSDGTREVEDDNQEIKNIPEVLIQGSRIMNVDVKRTEDDAQPYYILDSKQIEESGATNVEDFLKQQLTMNTEFLSNSQQYFNTAGATSAINLRGLGANETLILIDGRRSASVSIALVGGTSQPDINGIPLSAIERIEVLPGSASAIYGGAAVGGVINIVLKKNFQGGEINATYEDTVSGHAPIRTLNATYGFTLEDGKTRIMLSGHYSDAQSLLVQDRLDIVGRGTANILENSPSYFSSFLGGIPGATPNIASADGSNLVLKNGTPLNSPITHIPVGAAPGSNLSAGLLTNAGTYNLNLSSGTGAYGLGNVFGVSPTDKSFMGTLRRELTPSLEVFTEFSTFSNSSRELSNPFASAYAVPASAPSNPFQQSVTVTFPSAQRPVETTDSVTQSATVGLLAHLAGNWSSELDYTWSRNLFENASPSADYIDLPAALAAGTVNPFTDTIAYPLNLAPYVSTQTFTGNTTLDDVGLRASGSVGSLPWGRPTLTVGLEHRKEGTHNSEFYWAFPLAPVNNFDTLYFGQSQTTDSVYAEALLPLVTGENAVPLIRSLDLQLAGRSEHYAVEAGTPYVNLLPAGSPNPSQGVLTSIKYTSTNPTIGLKYKPLKDLTFRSSYAKAFLPPTAMQFQPNPTPACGFPCVPITDPRNGETYNVDFSQGGNPNLKPQTSRDLDLGMIWEPQEDHIKGLRMDIEYYDIIQPNYITQPGVQLVVSNPAYASRVTRDSTTGRITIVDDSPVNATEYKTSGWDLTLDYRKPTAVGTFDLHALTTMIQHDQRQYTIGGPFLNYLGYPADGGEAKSKASLTLSWEYRQWSLGWTTTYVGSYQQLGSPGDPVELQFPGSNAYVVAAQGAFTIPSQTYHSIFGSYASGSVPMKSRLASDALSNVTIQFGIKNLFNTLPPFDAHNFPFFYSPYGDPRLRDYWLSIRKSF
jgi:iron complex outermembrane receptor protein